MPMPSKDESKEEYIARFMGSEEAKQSHPDEKQRLAIANSMWEKHSKSKESPVMFTKVKEANKVYTFIGASTIPDRVASYLPDGTKVKGEILSKRVLDKFASYVNDSSRMGGDYGSFRTISLFHNRVKQRNYELEEAGYVLPGSAMVKELDEYPGHYGLMVDIEVNDKFTPPNDYSDYTPDKIHYKIDKHALGLSIEYNNRDDQQKLVSLNGDKYWHILDSDDFRGFGFARPDLIGNPTAVRVKELDMEYTIPKTETNINNEAKTKMVETNINTDLGSEMAKIKEEMQTLKGGDVSFKELHGKFDEMNSKFKELQLKNEEIVANVKESIQNAFSGTNFKGPSKTASETAKIKEVYAHAENFDWVKFKEASSLLVEANGSRIKEMLARDGQGFDFEKHQTLQIKVKGSQTYVVPSAKTKDVVNSGSMDEATYYQTNAMFADRYVAGINETFLKEDSYLKAMPKEQHLGGNDKYQWRIWIDYTTVTGSSTLAVDPDSTSVTRTKREFIKLETRICEYRDGVEVTDFTQHHSVAAIGDLLSIEINRAAEAVTESMNSDLFKTNVETTASWNGFVGLIAIGDAATYTSLYGRTRSAANRLLDSTAANTYLATAEAISVSIVRSGYEKVLAHGSGLANIAIVMHPTQCRRLFDTEDAAIRNNILGMGGAPPSWGFSRAIVPTLDGIPIIRDYRCELTAAAADTFIVVDLSTDKGHVLIISKPLGVRGLAKVGTTESAYVNFYGCAVYKSPRNIFVHTGLTAT